jgi:hypothetical protein
MDFIVFADFALAEDFSSSSSSADYDLSLSFWAHCLPVGVANELGSAGSFLPFAFITSSG